MGEKELRKRRCCFTGHRPEKLTVSEERLAALLEVEIRKAVDQEFTTFITGMAKGTDLIAAEIVLRLRERDSRLRLVAALPYPNFGQRWGGGWSERFQRVLSTADQIECVCPCSSWASYQLRNKWMVSHSALVIAAFNGESGGTKNTLDFARKQRVPCVVIDIGRKAIENVEEYGSYIIVNQGIALAHANKESGVYKDGLSLLISREGIRFEDGETVYMLFFFSTKGDADYLQLFKEIIKLGNSSDNLKKIRSADTPQNVYRLIVEILTDYAGAAERGSEER